LIFGPKHLTRRAIEAESRRTGEKHFLPRGLKSASLCLPTSLLEGLPL